MKSTDFIGKFIRERIEYHKQQVTGYSLLLEQFQTVRPIMDYAEQGDNELLQPIKDMCASLINYTEEGAPWESGVSLCSTSFSGIVAFTSANLKGEQYQQLQEATALYGKTIKTRLQNIVKKKEEYGSVFETYFPSKLKDQFFGILGDLIVDIDKDISLGLRTVFNGMIYKLVNDADALQYFAEQVEGRDKRNKYVNKKGIPTWRLRIGYLIERYFMTSKQTALDLLDQVVASHNNLTALGKSGTESSQKYVETTICPIIDFVLLVVDELRSYGVMTQTN